MRTKFFIPLEISSSDFLAWRSAQLAKGGRKVDFDWLLDLCGGFGWSELQKLYLYPSNNIQLSQPLELLENLWLIHLEHHTPLQYLVGRCPWRDFELEVNHSVLIPRQETELLVDFALQKLERCETFRWADLGTGSGAIAVAIAREASLCFGHAVDCCPEALVLARRNIQRLVPNSKVQIHLGDWWQPLKPWWGKLNLVLVNPPYIPSKLIQCLEPVVRDHEPHLALCGGEDGLSASRNVLSGAMKAMSPRGWLLMEHHHDQSNDLLGLMRDEGFEEISFETDLQGIRRFAICRHP